MAFSITSFPDECINPLCGLEVVFDVDDGIGVATGTPATLEVDLSNFIEDTQMIIDGVFVATVGAAADLPNNIIGLGTEGANLVTIIDGSLYGEKSLIVVDNGTSVTLTSRNCCDPITVKLTGLDGVAPTLSLSAYPIEPGLLENYEVRGCIECAGTTTDFCIVPKVTAIGCDVDTVTASKDLKGLVSKCLTTPEPVLQTATGMLRTAIDSSCSDVTIKASEFYGSPASYYGASVSETFKAINSLTLDVPADYCQAVGRKLLTVYESGATICTSQHWRLSLFVDGGITGGTMDFYDKSGSLILSETPMSSSADGCIIEAQGSIMDQVGIPDPTLVSSIEIYLPYAGGNAQRFTFNVECCSCSTEFVFLNNFGTYDSISLGCVIRGNQNTLHEYVEYCKPCGDTTSRGITAYCGESYKDFTVSLKDSSWYQEKALNAFLASKDVYVVCDNLLYSIQPLQNQVQTISKIKINPEYTFRMQSIQSI